MSALDYWTDETVETAIRLLVCAERLLAPYRSDEGECARVWEQINRFLKEDV